jgi:phenylacetate-CoA ligase
MKIVVERAEGCEASDGERLAKELVYQVKRKVLVTPVAEVVPYGALPRSERKSKRVFDTRIQDAIV